MQEENNTNAQAASAADYDESKIRHLDDVTHIRQRPGMYIGRLGDGSHAEDGIYVLLKETIDNSIDEFNEGFGKRIEVNILDEHAAEVRDYGRGIPLGALKAAVSQLNTGAKYDTAVFTASVGMNGVGLKAVNALSARFVARSCREGKMREVTFEKGQLVSDIEGETQEENGTYVFFQPDATLFTNFRFRMEFVENMLKNYTYLNTGLAIFNNNQRIISRNGLEDLLNDNMTEPGIYPIVHLSGPGIDIAFTHTQQYGEEYYSFVNGQHTTQGGTHQSAFKEHIARTIKEYFGKNFDVQDVRNGLVAAIAIRVIEPLFESQTKIKLGSLTMAPDKDSNGNPFPLSGVSVNKFVGDFVKENVDNYLHKHLDVADVLLQKIQENEKERKAIAGVTKLARERAKKANLHNRKLRDCRVHLNDPAPKVSKKKAQETEADDYDPRFDSAIFITEGDSASGSITKSRDVNTQAVFSLRGKPLNAEKKRLDQVLANEEFRSIITALGTNIDEDFDISALKYHKVIILSDADQDGAHIRAILLTFFYRYMRELVAQGHVYIGMPPLYLVKRPGSQEYAYDDKELRRLTAGKKNYTIQRYKGLGEMNPEQLWETTMDPAHRKLMRVTLEDAAREDEIITILMGDKVDPRREYIISHAEFNKQDSFESHQLEKEQKN